MSRWPRKAEDIIIAGWGEDILYGAILGYLSGVTPELAYKYIKDDMKLVDTLPDEWHKYRSLAKHLDLNEILNVGRILEKLSEERGDIVSIILNCPDGVPWLRRQLDEIKHKLTNEMP